MLKASSLQNRPSRLDFFSEQNVSSHTVSLIVFRELPGLRAVLKSVYNSEALVSKRILQSQKQLPLSQKRQNKAGVKGWLFEFSLRHSLPINDC